MVTPDTTMWPASTARLSILLEEKDIQILKRIVSHHMVRVFPMDEICQRNCKQINPKRVC